MAAHAAAYIVPLTTPYFCPEGSEDMVSEGGEGEWQSNLQRQIALTRN